MIGLSLSFCISDILAGRVTEGDVEQIITGTNAPDDEAWERLLDLYCDTYWSHDPQGARAIAQRLKDAGKIDQPRTRGERAGSVTQGWWKP